MKQSVSTFERDHGKDAYVYFYQYDNMSYAIEQLKQITQEFPDLSRPEITKLLNKRDVIKYKSMEQERGRFKFVDEINDLKQ